MLYMELNGLYDLEFKDIKEAYGTEWSITLYDLEFKDIKEISDQFEFWIFCNDNSLCERVVYGS